MKYNFKIHVIQDIVYVDVSIQPRNKNTMDRDKFLVQFAKTSLPSSQWRVTPPSDIIRTAETKEIPIPVSSLFDENPSYDDKPSSKLSKPSQQIKSETKSSQKPDMMSSVKWENTKMLLPTRTTVQTRNLEISPRPEMKLSREQTLIARRKFVTVLAPRSEDTATAEVVENTSSTCQAEANLGPSKILSFPSCLALAAVVVGLAYSHSRCQSYNTFTFHGQRG